MTFFPFSVNMMPNVENVGFPLAFLHTETLMDVMKGFDSPGYPYAGGVAPGDAIHPALNEPDSEGETEPMEISFVNEDATNQNIRMRVSSIGGRAILGALQPISEGTGMSGQENPRGPSGETASRNPAGREMAEPSQIHADNDQEMRTSAIQYSVQRDQAQNDPSRSSTSD